MNEYRAADNFLFGGRVTDVSPYGNGHINDTFAVTCVFDCGGSLRDGPLRRKGFCGTSPRRGKFNLQKPADRRRL